MATRPPLNRLPVALLAVVAATALIASCGRESPPGAASRPPLAGLSPVASSAGAGSGWRLWQDATIFDRVHAMLRSTGPGGRVWVEMYEFGRRDLALELLAARARGADVRLIVDRTVTVSARLADRLLRAGLQVRSYPVDDGRHQIDHVKLLVAGDDGLVGGMNWGEGSRRNHDYAVEVAAPAVVGRLVTVFVYDWALAGGQIEPVPPEGAGAVLETTPGQSIRSALEGAISAARASIAVEMFTLTDPDILAGLCGAYRRGLRVRVLLDPNQDVNLPGFDLLRETGVPVRWYPVPPGAKLHAKAGLFDGLALIVGSANWSRSGLSVNHELDLGVADPTVASEFASRFDLDWRSSPNAAP